MVGRGQEMKVSLASHASEEPIGQDTVCMKHTPALPSRAQWGLKDWINMETIYTTLWSAH